MLKTSILLLVATSASAHPAAPMMESRLTSKPMLKISSGLEDQKVLAGESTALRCEAISTPFAAFHWEFNGKRVQGDEGLNFYEKISNTGKQTVESGIISSTFHIPCASQKNAGVYKCVVFNGHMTVESTSEVQVDGEDSKCPSTHKTAPQITMQTESRFEMAGNTATLVCRADKKATWEWTFEGKSIEEDGRHSVLPNGDLVIENIQWEDMGDYTCIATTKYGFAQAETFLYPTKKTTV